MNLIFYLNQQTGVLWEKTLYDKVTAIWPDMLKDLVPITFPEEDFEEVQKKMLAIYGKKVQWLEN